MKANASVELSNFVLRASPFGAKEHTETTSDPFARVAPVLPQKIKCQGPKNRAEILNQNQRVAGAPEEIRTPDPQIRSLVLYPAELRALDSAAGNRTTAQRHSYRLGHLLARVADASGASGP
jgi:hypothetical protein